MNPNELTKQLEKLDAKEINSTKQTGVRDEDFSERIYNLALKVDRLRLENQELRIELEALRAELNLSFSLRYLIRSIRKIFWLKVNTKSRQFFKNIVGKLTSKGDNQQGFKDNNSHNSSFSPYQVKILHNIQNNRPRVLHAIANFYTGGSSQLVVDLIEHLGYRFEQEVIARDIPSEPSYVGLALHHHERFANPHQALSVLEKFRPDFIHVHYLGHHRDSYSELDWKWYNSLFIAAKDYNCRIIENINIPTDPYVSDLVNFYVYVSDYVNHEFGYVGSPNITIYPGSDLATFSKRNSFDIPDNCIGMVYRLEGDKLNEQSIDVFIKVIQLRPQTKALIVGGGRFLELYQNKVAQAGVSNSFTFTGYTSYELLPGFYEQMSLFVAPVHTESFGQVTPFAMGMQIPVVGYNVGALQEIIGDGQLLASPGDSDALASIIVELLDDRERLLQIGINNRQRAQKLFSVEAMIGSYSKLYEEMLKLPKVIS